MTIIQTPTAPIISTEEERAKILTVIKEISNSLARIEGEREYIKDAYTKLKEEHKLPKKLAGKMVKVYHKQNFDEVVATEEQFQQLYVSVTQGA